MPTIISILNILLLDSNTTQRTQALNVIRNNWHNRYSAMILETMSVVQSSEMYYALNQLLKNKTNQAIEFDSNAWYQWL